MSGGKTMTDPVRTLTFYVNGRKIEEATPSPEMTLLEFLRRKLRLTGSKLGCGEGGCGACTVMVSSYNHTIDRIEHVPVNACIAPVCSMYGLAVTTVEGIGNVRDKLHPVQRQIAASHGSQCGFCTPGIVMSMYVLLRNKPTPTMEEIQEHLDGNLCRCTGYRPILEGFGEFAKHGCHLGPECCQNSIQSKGQLEAFNEGQANDSSHNPQLVYDPSQEPIFPPELKINAFQLQNESLAFESHDQIWLSPTSISELLEIMGNNPECKLVCGNTEIGIEIKLKKKVFPVLVSISRIPDLQQLQQTDQGVQIGASVSLSKMEEFLKDMVRTLPEHKTRVFSAFIEMLKWFAGHQIRSVATLGGNIMNASPISDLNPLLLACKAVLDVMDRDGSHREETMDAGFFTGYRQTRLEMTDTVVKVTIPYSKQNEYFYGYKQAHRKEDDISIVNAGMRVDFGDTESHVSDISLAFGGMAITTVMATKTMETLIRRPWDSTTLELACSQDLLPSDLPLAPGSPGGMVAYRRTLTLSFFFKFHSQVSQRINKSDRNNTPSVESSAFSQLPHGVSKGLQIYQMPSDLQSPRDAVGRPIVHRSAFKQATGEAIYVDDVPVSDGELFAGFVLSTKSHAKIVLVDPSEALVMPGVVDFVCWKDVPGDNHWDGDLETVFAKDETIHEGQVIGLVLADSLISAKKAAKHVKVEYEELQPVITIQNAISEGSFFTHSHVLQCGDVTEGMSRAPYVGEGEFHMEGQEHFYLEPQACIIYPRDSDEYHVISMTQGLNSIQIQMAKVLGISENHISVSVKRIGGGFGGKETRHASVALPAAVAAYKTQRPVRAVLDRDEDMRLTGTRHPVLAKYKVGFHPNGRLESLTLKVYVNCGSTMDLSVPVAERCILTIGNAYKIPHTFVESCLCKTNIPSCTAFRGFGAPQAVAIIESILDHVTSIIKLPPEQVRERNFYKEGDKTIYGQIIEESNLLSCWQVCQEQSQYLSRLDFVQEFNRANTFKKRGVSLVPLTYGLGFPLPSLNKAGVLINIYSDGSVLLHTGGVEMGQGLHTKLIQVTSRALDIPVSYIRVPDTTTDVIPNATATAGSMSSDLFGMAVVNACEQLKKRLAPHRTSNKEWKDVAADAIDKRECLSAVGFYSPGTSGMDWGKKDNSPFFYYSYGAACTEVEIDCLTGDHQVIKTDIVMDLGHSLNPAIDVGQIEGAFTQGYGLLVLEQYKVTSKGTLLTQGPGNYKIPSFGNIPHTFNVTLLKNKGNPSAVYSSKAIGEPPLCLAMSVFLAIKSAIRAARTDNGQTEHFQLDSPATPDKIRMACMDRLAQQFVLDDEKDKAKPWFVKL